MVFSHHEHRLPPSPSLVAHLLKVAGAISLSSIVRGRHRSATAYSFVLCGVPSASFVRGSHEQDSVLTAGPQPISHPWRPGSIARGGAIYRRRPPARRLDPSSRSPPRRRWGAVVGPRGPGPL